ncbi:hypothetical protein DERP_013201 [Dermatophagoides pteronyssinus]|uniref:Uncharacterized protein n=1 Tax=Dermatophagoides pteronyssinus TaxID=6956 RepID=A0ABQ8J3L8_DERPT|nr:hypothetical protein DERP_013201 [Dermatophagoides pteronyssinus]
MGFGSFDFYINKWLACIGLGLMTKLDFVYLVDEANGQWLAMLNLSKKKEESNRIERDEQIEQGFCRFRCRRYPSLYKLNMMKCLNDNNNPLFKQ